MVVDNDDFKPSTLGLRQRVIGHRPTIHRNDQAATAITNAHQGFARGAIALHQAVWDIIACVQFQHAQQANEKRRTGRAVDVIVSVDGDLLARLNGLRQSKCGTLHILKYRRIGHEVANGRVALPFDIIACDTARHQQLGDEIIRLKLGVAAIGAAATPVPGLFKDRVINVEDWLHPSSLWRAGSASKWR